MFIRSRRPDVGTREPPRASRAAVAVPSATTRELATGLHDSNEVPRAGRGTSSSLLSRHSIAAHTYFAAAPSAGPQLWPHDAWSVREDQEEPAVWEAELSPVTGPFVFPPAATHLDRHPTYAGDQKVSAPRSTSAPRPASLERAEDVPLYSSAAIARSEDHGLRRPHADSSAVVPHVYADEGTPLHVSPLAPASPGESRQSPSHLANITAAATDTARDTEREFLTRSPNGASAVCRPLLLPPQQPSDNTTGTAAAAAVAPSPGITTVTALGRTLAAAASALTAAAQRERDEAAARLRRWQVERARTFDRDATLDVLLDLAVKEKLLLMDAFSTGLWALSGVMDECAALRRREELQLRHSEADAQLAVERETRRKVALYREHLATAHDRAAAEQAHTRALQQCELQLHQLRAELAAATQHAQAAETRLEEQDRAHAHAMAEVCAAMTEQSMELRALQRAHGQATERWLTAVTLYEGMRRHIAAVLLQRTAGEHATGRVRRVQVHGHNEVGPPRMLHTPVQSEESNFLQQALASAHIRVAAKAAPSSENGRHLDRDGAQVRQTTDRVGAEAGGEEPATALELLLARTTSDSVLGGAAVRAGSGAPTLPPPSPTAFPTSRTAAGSAAARQSSPPTAPGGLSSPPGTPLPQPSKAPVPTAVHVFEGREPLDGGSPDPAVPLRDDDVDRDNNKGTSAGADGDAETPDAAAPAADSSGSGERHSSSFRPSRLNSVASTRRGSWAEASSEPQASGPPHPDKEAAVHATGEPTVAITTAADVAPLSRATSHEGAVAGVVPVSDARRSSDVAAPLPSSVGSSGSAGGGGSLASVYAALEAVAAAAVQRECARLLDVAAVECEKGVAPTSPRKLLSSGVAKPHNSSVDTALDHAVHGEHLSIPRDARGVPSSVTAQRCMRVGEVARTMARLLSRLLQRLRKVAASLQQRVALLEAKDWNKTMAHQFVAVDHVAAVQRLVADVERVLGAGAEAAALS